MYNENVKLDFLKMITKSIRRQRMESIFTSFESFEREHMTDICDMPIEQFCEGLKECLNINKFVAFYEYILCYQKYVDYCTMHKIINPSVKYAKNSKDISMDELYRLFFDNQQQDEFVLATPDTLFDHLQRLYHIEENVISVNTLMIAYVMLIYFGVPYREATLILKDGIFEDGDEIIVTAQSLKEYHIEGKTVKIIKQIAAGRFLETKGKSLKELNDVYLLCRESDNNSQLVIKRSMKYYNKYFKDRAESNNADMFIGLNIIAYNGIIYRMGKFADKKYADKNSLTDQEILKIYKIVSGKQIPNNPKIHREVISLFRKKNI